MAAFVRSNMLDQALDIAGSLTKNQSRTLTDENNGFGSTVVSGTVAVTSAVAAGIADITGLTGMTAASAGRFLTIAGDAQSANNGTYLIVEYVSATAVKISNSAAVVSTGVGNTWTEHEPYSLADDLDCMRTDRKLMKGTSNWYDNVPTYQRPDAVGTLVPANLTNIASKTTDAKALIINKLVESSVSASSTFITITDTGNLKHADAVNKLGVPCFDAAPDVGNHNSTYVEIINAATGQGLTVLTAGADFGKRIYGRTRAGSSVSPNSVEIEFRAVGQTAALSTSVAYTWEAGQPTLIELYYGERQRLDTMDEDALRTTLVHGMISDADSRRDINDLQSIVGSTDDTSSLAGLLTNTGNYFAFSALDPTPSVVESLNTLNYSIGDRVYSGVAVSHVGLVSGEQIATSIQKLGTVLSQSQTNSYVERVGADILAGTPHTIPNSLTYVIDPTYNSQYLTVIWRGLTRVCGPLTLAGSEYEETSTTSVTFYQRIKAGDVIRYIIKS